MKAFVPVVLALSAVAAPRSAIAQELFLALSPQDPASPEIEPPAGTSLEAGVGVADFARGAASALSFLGGAWQARAAFGTRSPIGFELAYAGSAQLVQASGLGGDAVLERHGLESHLRLNLPMSNGVWLVVPHVFAGVGWSYFDLDARGPNVSRVRPEDHVLVLPVGAGLSAAIEDVVVGARVGYTAAFDEELVRTPSGGSADLDAWSVTASLGAAL